MPSAADLAARPLIGAADRAAQPFTGAVQQPPVPQPRLLRRSPEVRLRREPFGALAYVPSSDRFFALGKRAADLVEYSAGWRLVLADPAESALIDQLASRGICGTDPPTRGSPAGDRAWLGDFPTEPVPDLPMVVNCLVTPYCALRCRYCHADNLMGPFQPFESDVDLPRIAATAGRIPAMVVVVTGGDPLLRPDRARRLMAAVGGERALVVDTSGVGDLDGLLPVVETLGAHLRVSLDCADQRRNDALRPVAGRYRELSRSAYTSAVRAIERARDRGVPTTVQTVVGAHNEDLGELLRLRDLLAGLGVRNWVIHVTVAAGKAALPRNSRLLPSDRIEETLARLTDRVVADGVDIRIAASHRRPNAVLLVNSRGDLYVEHGGIDGKTLVGGPDLPAEELTRRALSAVDLGAHAARYLGRPARSG